MIIEGNLKLLKTLDDARNSQDWDTFNKRYVEIIVLYWPVQTELTRGRLNYKSEAIGFFKTFPDDRMDNDPYSVLFGIMIGLLR